MNRKKKAVIHIQGGIVACSIRLDGRGRVIDFSATADEESGIVQIGKNPKIVVPTRCVFTATLPPGGI